MSLEDIVSRQKWQEEDDGGEDVKDNWEDEDEEPPKPVPKADQPPKAKPFNKRAAQKAGELNNESNKPLTAQELREKRLQEEKAQKESDFRLTKQMLGMEDKDIALEFPLSTKEDFDNFHKNLVHKLWCYDKSPHYPNLLERLFRDLCAPLEADELKSLSSTVNALFNEKVKVNKNKPKKKAIKGLALKVERNQLNDRDDYDELDDIM